MSLAPPWSRRVALATAVVMTATAAPAVAAEEDLPASTSTADPWSSEQPWLDAPDVDATSGDGVLGLLSEPSLSLQSSSPSLTMGSGGFVRLPSTPAPLRIDGGGWGHGVGMSQYGAYEMARQGRSATQILQHYHRGTSVPRVAVPSQFRVGLLSQPWGSGAAANQAAVHFPNLKVTATDGPIQWQTCTTRTGGCSDVVQQPKGAVWVAGHANGRLVLREDDGSQTYINSSAPTFIRARLGTGNTPRAVRIDRKTVSGRPSSGFYQWGSFEVRKPLSGHSGVRATIDLGGQFERYVRGILEVPLSWPDAALRAQAVAARSYALARPQTLRSICDCVLTDGPENQVYRGAEGERGPSGDRWVAAVDATPGRVVAHNDTPVATFYSSSHNRRSENVQDVWSATQAYHQSVDDPFSRTTANPFRSWTATPANSGLASRVSGISVVTYVRILERTAGGTPTRLEVHGRDGSGNQVVRELTAGKNVGLSMKSWFGLRSAQIDRVSFSSFNDVHGHGTRAHVYDIARLQQAGLTDGCGDTGGYCPDRLLRRGEMAAFLWRAAGSPTPSRRHSFPDVPRSAFYDTAVSWLVEQGITDGYGNTGRFEPNFAVKRGEMAAFLHRAAGEPAPSRRHSFSDVSANRYFDRPVSWLVEVDITQGFGNGTYRPNAEVPRSQMASFIARFLEAVR